MAWIGPAIGAAAGIFGDVMSSQGQQQTNAQMTQNMLQQEGWQEQMSNTAIQRRVGDLKAAGLNPMLAVGTSGAQVAGVGQPSLQNPDASMSNLGGQVSSAIQLASQNAQVDQMHAQADKTRADTAVTMSQLPYSGATAKQNLENMQEQMYQINQQAASLKSQFELNTQNALKVATDRDFQVKLLDLQTAMNAVDLQRSQLGLPKLANDAAWQKAHPELSGLLQSGAIQGFGSAISSAAKIGTMIP